MYINGQRKESSNGKVIKVINMSTMEIVGEVPAGTERDAQEALIYGQQGAKEWGKVPTYKRVELIKLFTDKVRANLHDLAQLLSKENGKPLKQAVEEIESVIHIFNGFAEESKRLFGETIPLDIQPGLEEDLLISLREPLGLVIGIIPFNYPAELFSWKVGASLASGNAIIVKPPEEAPLTILKLVELMLEAGVPGNVLQAVTGFGEEVGVYLTESPLSNCISFTGSYSTGVSIYQKGAEHLARVFLELSGNDAVIVCENADISRAVDHVIEGRLESSGQICCTNKRILIQRSIYDSFTNNLIDKLATKVMGNQLDSATDIGPLISIEAAIRVEEQIKHTISQGAKLICGGRRIKESFIEPTVLGNVTSDMDIANDMEVFGPVFPLLVFDTLDEAIGIVNQSSFGLNSAIFTQDIQEAFYAGKELEAGIVVINGGPSYRPFCAAFGGHKKSGIGVEGLAYTLKEFTQLKSIVFRGVMK